MGAEGAVVARAKGLILLYTLFDKQLPGPVALTTHVTGAPYREVNSKVATAPKLKVEDKDRVNNSRRIKNG